MPSTTRAPLFFAVVAAFGGLSACSPAPGPERASGPDLGGVPSGVLLVSLDTVRADRLSLYGGPVQVPHLAALAASGMVFDDVTTTFPETAMSHWAMLTGVLPEVHGNVPAFGTSRYSGGTVAEILSAAGWDTAAFIGGVTLLDTACGLSRGFGVYDDPIDPNDPDGSRPATEVVHNAQAWIAGRRGPWFAFVHLFDAHYPYGHDPAELAPWMEERGAGAPPATVEGARSSYDARIRDMDLALAPLLDALPPSTVVIVTSDHGESFEHGYLFNHRAVLWDGVIRVPLVIHSPGLAAGRAAETVSLLDLAPTLLGLAGVASDAPFQGKALIAGGDVVGPEREGLWVRTDPWSRQKRPLLGLRTPDWTVVWSEEGQAVAYDRHRDPREEHPQAPPSELLALRASYDEAVRGMAPHQAPLGPPRAPTPWLNRLGYMDAN
ncbi:MAG: sulfatase [Pseudomonadota bacterium]